MASLGKQASFQTPKSGSHLSLYRIALSKAELTTHMAPSLIDYQCMLRSLCMLAIEDSQLGGYFGVCSRFHCSTGRKWFALHTDCPMRRVCVARVLMERFISAEDGAEMCLIVYGGSASIAMQLIPRSYCGVSYMNEGRIKGEVLCSRARHHHSTLR